MRRSEITRKFDEIVDFAGIEKYIDTPVKRYSSGMYVRLAFAVAAHLESEILIVDEVLAVGDAEFQKKCLGKMDDVSKGEGRTVLFVSHNLASINNLCLKSILLEKGNLSLFGETDAVINLYNQKLISTSNNLNQGFNLNLKSDFYELQSISLEDKIGNVLNKIDRNTEVYINLKYLLLKDNLTLGTSIVLKDKFDNIVFSSISNSDDNFYLIRQKGDVISLKCGIPRKLLNNITYKISVFVFDSSYSHSYSFDDILIFNVDDIAPFKGDFLGKVEGAVRPNLKWSSF